MFGFLASKGLHGRASAVLRALGGLAADDFVIAALAARVLAGLGLVAVLLLVCGVDAEPGEEPLVAVVVHRDHLVVEQVNQRDGGLLAVQLGGRPLADQFTGGEVVRCESDVRGVCRVRRSVERNDEQACVLGLLQGVNHGRAVGGDQNAFIALGDGVFDGLDLGVLIAVGLACRELQIDAAGLGSLLGSVLHGHEEGVGRGLYDQRDADLFGRGASGGGGGGGISAAGGEAERAEGQDCTDGEQAVGDCPRGFGTQH
ncbi:hypothetical protein QFZ33_000554 [Arthrobacter globiformis]|nr:hypothetical protein [Arthrobacter globiformis]